MLKITARNVIIAVQQEHLMEFHVEVKMPVYISGVWQ